MICFFVTDAHAYPVNDYLDTWARSLRKRCTVAGYESLDLRRRLRAHAFIFTDLERLTPGQCEAAERLAERIESSGGRILNRPARVLRRFELLRALHERGQNPFNVHRIAGSALPATTPLNYRFPVFIRDENEHTGALTPLLHDVDELQSALRSLGGGRNLLVVEYCETRAEGRLYRKYAAMRVADRFVPRHVLFGEDWVNKRPAVVTEHTIAEEREFLRDFPHDADVRKVYEVAQVDYGRIDYSCVGGRIVTWEINTNPVVVPMPEKCDPRRMEGQAVSARRINEALAALDGPDVAVPLAGLPSIFNVRPPLRSATLRSTARLWQALARVPLGRRAVHALKRSLDLSAQRA